MSAWNNRATWTSLIDGSGCPICVRGEPHDIIASLGASWVTMPEAAPVKGYVCVVAKVHAVELHDLDQATSSAFMRDLQRTSAAVTQATGAIKLNYEIHGNTIPHLHMHIYPRFAGDAFEGKPIDPRGVTTAYGPGEFEAFRRRVIAALDGVA